MDIARQEEPSATGGSLAAGLGWVWRALLVEVGASVDRSAVTDGDEDLPLESVTQIGAGGALGLLPGYGLEAAITGGRGRVLAHYRDEEWDFERDGWLFGLRGVKTWPLAGRGWAFGFELGAELSWLDKNPQERQRPLVWTYRLRLVLVRQAQRQAP